MQTLRLIINDRFKIQNVHVHCDEGLGGPNVTVKIMESKYWTKQMSEYVRNYVLCGSITRCFETRFSKIKNEKNKMSDRTKSHCTLLGTSTVRNVRIYITEFNSRKK